MNESLTILGGGGTEIKIQSINAMVGAVHNKFETCAWRVHVGLDKGCRD